MSIDKFKRLLEGSFTDNEEDLTWLVKHKYIVYDNSIFGNNSYKVLKAFDWDGHYNNNNTYLITKGPKQGIKPIK